MCLYNGMTKSAKLKANRWRRRKRGERSLQYQDFQNDVWMMGLFHFLIISLATTHCNISKHTCAVLWLTLTHLFNLQPVVRLAVFTAVWQDDSHLASFLIWQLSKHILLFPRWSLIPGLVNEGQEGSVPLDNIFSSCGVSTFFHLPGLWW